MRTRARRLGTALNVETRKQILQLVERVGEPAASRILRVSTPTVARAAAGFPMWEGTCELIEARLRSVGT
jgi:hypothetical protein